MKELGVYIPGRLTSQRLPNKLILPMGNTCLWEIACEKLSKLPAEYGRYVMTADKELTEIALKYSITILERDPATARTDDPIVYTMGDIRQAKEKYMMFLNPCLAFLSLEVIINSLKTFAASSHSYATSVKPFKNWLFMDKTPIIEPEYKSLNTKEIKPMWQAAHCFHIFNKEQFLQDGMMLKPGHELIPVPEHETIDVDTYEEYEYARWKWEHNLFNTIEEKLE